MCVRKLLPVLVGAVVVFAAAKTSPAAYQFSVDSGDLVNGEYRLQYSSQTDKYYENGSEILSGWQSGAYSYSNLKRYASWDQRWYLMPNSGPPYAGTMTWKFDFSQTGLTITDLHVQSSSHVFHHGGGSNDWVKYYVSTNGTDWVNYCTNTSGSTAGIYYDLTEHVAGSDKYLIKVEAHADSSYTHDAQIFREAGAAPRFDNQVTLIPEPSTLVIWSLLGAIGITIGWWRPRRKG